MSDPMTDMPETPLADDLATRLEQAEQKVGEYLELARRAQAEFDNYQKRASRDREQEYRYREFGLARDLLPVLDNLERALLAAQNNEAAAGLAQGVTATVAQFLDILKRHQITPIDAQGQPFDPNLHEAVMQQPAADHPPNTVVRVVQKGFRLHERVLRPATVIVSVASPADGAKQEG